MATADESDIYAEIIEGFRRPTGPMTEDEFVAWSDEDVRAEWVDGEVIIMSPCSSNHVRIVGWLNAVLAIFVEDRNLGEVFGPELTTRFAALRQRRVPDLFFVARDRLDLVLKNHFEGAPDLAVEVVSPDSQERDRRDKYAAYAKVGVREYWMIDPDEEELKVYVLGDRGRYRAVKAEGGRVASAAVPGFYLRPGWLWQRPLPSKRDVLRELDPRG